MPVLSPNAPYDSLATVTQLVRTVLADYIQGITPNVAGVINTAGTVVTWVSGAQFSYLFQGAPMTIGGQIYPVAQVLSPTSLVLLASAGVQAGVAYQAALPTGDIFADSQAYVLPTVNLAWRKVQKKLADKGHPRLTSEIDLFSLPVITNLDPVSQQWIDWSFFFDGTTLLSPTTNPVGPVLPSDFVSPLRLWERQSGMTIQFSPMRPAGDALYSRNKGSYNCYFDWREDKLYFPGSLLSMDLRIRYAAFLPDLVVGTGQTFSQVPVPILRAAEALANYAAEIFVIPRGGIAVAPSYAEAGDEAIEQILNSWTKLQQRSSFHRRAWPGSRRNSRGY